jgi:hypothetical protein
VLGEFDEVPIVPLRSGHRLVSVVEGRLAEGVIVPLDTGYFAGFTTDAGGYIYILTDIYFALRATTGDGTGVGRDLLNL